MADWNNIHPAEQDAEIASLRARIAELEAALREASSEADQYRRAVWSGIALPGEVYKPSPIVNRASTTLAGGRS